MRTLLGTDGTAGAVRSSCRETAYPWPSDPLLILFSDGIETRWSLNDYPGLHRRHPSLIAGVLFRDHRRERDDATIVVAVPRRSAV